MTAPPCESEFADRIVIVLGTIRSGTTWLTELLRAHPDIAVTDRESWIFHGLWELWENVHSSTGDGPASYLGQDHVVATMRAFCDQIFAAARDRHGPGASWFVEKTPGHVERLALIAATHPDAWYIHLVRDGRDVARSIVRAPWGQTRLGDAAAHWASGVRRVHEHRWQLERFAELRYEDLLADPVGLMTQLFGWMGLPVDADVEKRLAEHATHEVVRFSATDPVGAGKWRDMSMEDLAQIYEEAGDLLIQLGYADSGSGPPPGAP
jgi:hypothetical protein